MTAEKSTLQLAAGARLMTPLNPGKQKKSARGGGGSSTPLPPRKKWLFRGLLLVFPFLLLAMAEAALRLGGYGFDPDFFQRRHIGSEDFFVQNEDFSFRFFPRETARNPGPIRFPAVKAPGTFRIFIFGESAAMGDPAESFAPDRYLGALLRAKYPDRKFEIINVAFTAINSHVILPIARACAKRSGDLWIIYMGNNEMVGPFGATSVFGWRAPPWPAVRLVLALERLRLGQLLMNLGRRMSQRPNQQTVWGGMGMFLHSEVSPRGAAREMVCRNFQRNLDDILRAGLGSGAKVMLNTMAVNLKDCPPFASLVDSNLPPSAHGDLDRLLDAARQARAQGRLPDAEALFARAAALDGTCAEAQFEWGQCLLAETNLAAAREHFQTACDDDALPFRADSRINASIRAERAKFSPSQLIFADAETALSQADGGICGDDTFFEHVHFDFDARHRLARLWADKIETLLGTNANVWLSPAACEANLGLTEWNRAQAIHFMSERMELPPLSSQANNAQRRAALEARIAQLRERMTPARAARVKKDFAALVAQRPDDYFLREEFAVFLELCGDVTGAADQWEGVRELLPQDSVGYYEHGRLLISQQHYSEAESELRTSLAIRPSRAEAWVELGNALALQQKHAEALASFTTALRLDPWNAETHLREGKVLAHLRRHGEAIASYRAAIQLKPQDWISHHELALELSASGQLDAAGDEFRQASLLAPGSVVARYDYGAWLVKQRRWDEAEREFTAVTQLDPANERARRNVAALQAMARRR